MKTTLATAARTTAVERCGFSQKVLNPDPIATGAALGLMPLARFTLVHPFRATNLDHLSFSHRLSGLSNPQFQARSFAAGGEIRKNLARRARLLLGLLHHAPGPAGENEAGSDRTCVDEIRKSRCYPKRCGGNLAQVPRSFSFSQKLMLLVSPRICGQPVYSI